MARVAFFTFGILREEFGHPDTKGFEDRIEGVFAAASTMPGFIQLATAMEEGETEWPRFKRPERAEGAQTLSLWTDLACVYAFAYGGAHAEALRRRKEWFVKPAWPTYVAWWVDDDHMPTWREAIERFERLHDHGPTPHAFNFKTPFDAQGQPAQLRPAT